jgi:hypothetical protein
LTLNDAARVHCMVPLRCDAKNNFVRFDIRLHSLCWVSAGHFGGDSPGHPLHSISRLHYRGDRSIQEDAKLEELMLEKLSLVANVRDQSRRCGVAHQD